MSGRAREGAPAFRAALVAAAALLLAIAAGSRGFRDLDLELVHYAAVSVVAVAAVAHRAARWAARPATRRVFARAAGIVRAEGAGALRSAGRLGAERLGAQAFIARRSAVRWLAHLCLSWGSMLAFAITFPLVFGWVHFESAPHDPASYRTVVFGHAVAEMPVDSWRALAAFHALNASGVLVAVGVLLAVVRRFRDAGDRALQSFAHDGLPLLLLFAVAASGLSLTASSHVLAGRGYEAAALAHFASVAALLLYLPFGKLAHAFQRPAHVAVGVAKRSRAGAVLAACRRCAAEYAPAIQVADLERVLGELGTDFAFPGGHYQTICPPCRRRLVALGQGRLLGR